MRERFTFVPTKEAETTSVHRWRPQVREACLGGAGEAAGPVRVLTRVSLAEGHPRSKP